MEIDGKFKVPTFHSQASTLSSATEIAQFVDEALQLVVFTVNHCSNLFFGGVFGRVEYLNFGREKLIVVRKM